MLLRFRFFLCIGCHDVPDNRIKAFIGKLFCLRCPDFDLFLLPCTVFESLCGMCHHAVYLRIILFSESITGDVIYMHLTNQHKGAKMELWKSCFKMNLNLIARFLRKNSACPISMTCAGRVAINVHDVRETVHGRSEDISINVRIVDIKHRSLRAHFFRAHISLCRFGSAQFGMWHPGKRMPMHLSFKRSWGSAAIALPGHGCTNFVRQWHHPCGKNLLAILKQ